MNRIEFLRNTRVFQMGVTSHRMGVTRIRAGEFIDLTLFNEHDDANSRMHHNTMTGEIEESASSSCLSYGVCIVTGPYMTIVGTPGHDFHFGIKNMGCERIEAVVDSEFVCFSPLLLEDFLMYKTIAYTPSAPVTLSDADGMYLCVLSGKADIGGQMYTPGMRFDLIGATPTIVTPVEADGIPLQYLIVSLRSAPVAVTVPHSVSPRQIRQALTQAGLRAQVEGAVAAGDQNTKDWWEFATLIERSNPQVVGMGAALGVNAEQMDALFTMAASL